MQKNPIPMEWYIAFLAALTVPLSVYANLPMWATYVTWAGAFLVGPNEAIRKLYPKSPNIIYNIGYSARSSRVGSEVMFFSKGMKIPPLVGPIQVTEDNAGILRAMPAKKPLKLALQKKAYATSFHRPRRYHRS